MLEPHLNFFSSIPIDSYDDDKTDIDSGEPTGGSTTGDDPTNIINTPPTSPVGLPTSDVNTVPNDVDRVTNDNVIGAHAAGDGPVPTPDSGDGTTPNPNPDITISTPDSGNGTALNPDVRDDANDNDDASYSNRWGHRHGTNHYNLCPRRNPAYHAKHSIQWSRYGVATAELIKTELGVWKVTICYKCESLRPSESTVIRLSKLSIVKSSIWRIWMV